MALPYIERAASLVSESRDIAALKARIHLGIGDRAGAITALETALSLPNATDADTEALAALKNGQDPRTLRKTMIFRKVGINDPDLVRHPPAEQILAAVHVAKQIYDLDPTDPKAAEA